MTQDGLFAPPAPPAAMYPVVPMAEPMATGVTAAFPDPPKQFIQLYSDENVVSGSCPLPPKPVTDGTYSMFGTQITSDDSIIRSLEAQGMRRLYPREFDHKRELKKMNHSILFNFVDLIDVLAKCPDTMKREEKCQDIHILFIQMHHLINELRPHQARETIRVTLEVQKRERAFTAISMNAQVQKVTDAISKCLDYIPDSLLHLKETVEQDLRRLRDLCLRDKSDACVTDPIDEMVELDSIMCNIVNENQVQ